jgi:hypothetical protein
MQLLLFVFGAESGQQREIARLQQHHTWAELPGGMEALKK